jgi:hypothetical protein
VNSRLLILLTTIDSAAGASHSQLISFCQKRNPAHSPTKASVITSIVRSDFSYLLDIANVSTPQNYNLPWSFLSNFFLLFFFKFFLKKKKKKNKPKILQSGFVRLERFTLETK